MLNMRNVLRLLIWFGLASLTAMVGLACGRVNAAETLVHFYSNECQPCREMEPVVADLETDGYSIRHVNVDVDRAAAVQYRVTALPCFVLLNDGQEQRRLVGKSNRARLEGLFSIGGRPRAPQNPGVQPGPAPTPAWRYERPVHHRAAVVRIGCHDVDGGLSYGSGVLVRYSGLCVVVTASHVTRAAKAIQVWFYNGRVAHARILSADSTWDVSVLGLDATPPDIEPAELEYGAEAMQQAGNRLESCGYGRDGKLACNNGLFLQYAQPAGAAARDWMEFSGHARQGDSGGPVFNAQGHVVGILWGTDGTKVVGVQAGRLHLALQMAAQANQRNTPASVAVPQTSQCPCTSESACAATAPVPAQTDPSKRFLLPYRADENQHNRATDERLDRISTLLLEMQMANQEKRSEPALATPATQNVEPAQDRTASPLIAGLCILGAVLAGTILYFAVAASKE